jgi:dienelactone hydrolase
MAQREDIEFEGEGGVMLRGWLLLSDGPGPHPAITMAHGYAGVKEHGLERFAQAFADDGFVVLLHDHRGFGASGGEPRQDVDPWRQIADWRRAISYLESRSEVDGQRIGLWGTSYAGGHAIVLGATDRRLRCVVAQVPTISGWESTLRRSPPQALAGQRRAFDADRLERFRGGAPKMVPMVIDPAAGGAASHASPDAWEFFTGQKSPPEDQWRFRNWRNEITLRSLELYSEYEPGWFIERDPGPHRSTRGKRRPSSRT